MKSQQDRFAAHAERLRLDAAFLTFCGSADQGMIVGMVADALREAYEEGVRESSAYAREVERDRDDARVKLEAVACVAGLRADTIAAYELELARLRAGVAMAAKRDHDEARAQLAAFRAEGVTDGK